VYSCFGIFFTSRPSSLDANHRPLEDEKRRAAQELANAGAKAVLDGGRAGGHRTTFRKVHSFIHTLIRTLVAVESLLERVCG
jgi:hypothetical protein